MKRKIVQHGCSSLTITLPFSWVKKYSLKKGDEIDVEEKGAELIVSTGKSVDVSKKVISTDFGYFTKNNLTHLYQLGYDEIEIAYGEEKTLRDIKERLQECIGFEIVEHKGNKIVIKSIANMLESEFDTLLRKSFIITDEMGKEILDVLGGGKFSKLKEIRHQEFLNNKFTMTCVRMLSKRGYKNPRREMQIYDICKCLERIADQYKYICDLLFDHKRKISKESLDFFEDVIDYFSVFYKMFYKFDPELKEYIYTNRKKLISKGENLLKKTGGEEAILVHYLLAVINITHDAAGEYFASIL